MSDLGAYSADNIDGERSREGIDLELNWDCGYGDFTAAYSYLDAEQTANGITTTELRRARHQGSLTYNTDFGTEKFSFYTKLAYTGVITTPSLLSLNRLRLGAVSLYACNR